MFNQAVQLSLKSDNENTLKYTIGNLQDLKDKLTCVALPDNWLVWHNGNDSMRFIRPNLLDNTISVDIYLEVNSFLSVSPGFMDRQYLLHSTQLTISDKLNLYYTKFPQNLLLIILTIHIHTTFLVPKNILR